MKTELLINLYKIWIFYSDDFKETDEAKLVILCLDMGLYHLTEFLTNGKMCENESGRMLYRSGAILPGIQEQLSVFECHQNTVCDEFSVFYLHKFYIFLPN